MKFLSVVLALSCFAHATVVATLGAKDGLVMAADGMALSQQANPSHRILSIKEASLPKIAICGGRFVCGMAGQNPLHINKSGRKVEYEFEHWVSTLAGGTHATSPLEFSNLIQKQARITFREMNFFLRTEPYWNGNYAPDSLVRFQVIGYSGETPQVCFIDLKVDKSIHRLIYSHPECITPQWKSASPTTFVLYPLSMPEDMEKALSAGTLQAHRFSELQPKTIASAATLLSDAPPALHNIVGTAAALIQVTDEFSPDKAGGETIVGVVRKGVLPTVFKFSKF